MAKLDTPAHLNVMFLSTLSVLLKLKLVKVIFTPPRKNQ